jgi:hypothetical protein
LFVVFGRDRSAVLASEFSPARAWEIGRMTPFRAHTSQPSKAEGGQEIRWEIVVGFKKSIDDMTKYKISCSGRREDIKEIA